MREVVFASRVELEDPIGGLLRGSYA